jgi:hypothetical protein
MKKIIVKILTDIYKKKNPKLTNYEKKKIATHFLFTPHLKRICQKSK